MQSIKECQVRLSWNTENPIRSQVDQCIPQGLGCSKYFARHALLP